MLVIDTIFDSTYKDIDKVINREQRREQGDNLLDIAIKPAIFIRSSAIFKHVILDRLNDYKR